MFFNSCSVLLPSTIFRALCLNQVRWSTKKAAGTTNNGRDSHSKRLGFKKFGGEAVESGNIIIRQRGTRFHPGLGVGIGRDHTIFATIPGTIMITEDRSLMPRRRRPKQFISVMSHEQLQKIEGEVKVELREENKAGGINSFRWGTGEDAADREYNIRRI